MTHSGIVAFEICIRLSLVATILVKRGTCQLCYVMNCYNMYMYTH